MMRSNQTNADADTNGTTVMHTNVETMPQVYEVIPHVCYFAPDGKLYEKTTDPNQLRRLQEMYASTSPHTPEGSPQTHNPVETEAPREETASHAIESPVPPSVSQVGVRSTEPLVSTFSASLQEARDAIHQVTSSTV